MLWRTFVLGLKVLSSFMEGEFACKKRRKVVQYIQYTLTGVMNKDYFGEMLRVSLRRVISGETQTSVMKENYFWRKSLQFVCLYFFIHT